MKPAPFAYHRPETIGEVSGMLSKLGNARILAGGQSLMAMLNMRYVQVDHIIDIGRIPGLAGVAQVGDAIEIGAMTRQATLARSELLATHAPLMVEALGSVGHLQTRNRGTIGGSLCHLDPAAELPSCALALGATLVAAGPHGEREIPADSWFMGYMTPALEPGEFLKAIRIPAQPRPAAHAFLEFSRRTGDFAMASVACQLGFDGRGRIARAAVVVAGLAVRPARCTAAEQALVGTIPDDAGADGAAQTLSSAEVLADAYGDAAYRQHLAVVLAGRALKTAFGRRLHG